MKKVMEVGVDCSLDLDRITQIISVHILETKYKQKILDACSFLESNKLLMMLSENISVGIQKEIQF